MEQAKPQVTTLSIQVWAKSLIMSAVGIFSFFIHPVIRKGLSNMENGC